MKNLTTNIFKKFEVNRMYGSGDFRIEKYTFEENVKQVYFSLQLR